MTSPTSLIRSVSSDLALHVSIILFILIALVIRFIKGRMDPLQLKFLIVGCLGLWAILSFHSDLQGVKNSPDLHTAADRFLNNGLVMRVSTWTSFMTAVWMRVRMRYWSTQAKLSVAAGFVGLWTIWRSRDVVEVVWESVIYRPDDDPLVIA